MILSTKPQPNNQHLFSSSSSSFIPSHHITRRNYRTERMSLPEFFIGSKAATTGTAATCGGSMLRRCSVPAVVFLLLLSLVCLLIYTETDTFGFPPSYYSYSRPAPQFWLNDVPYSSSSDSEEYKLEKILKDASMQDHKTVILTTLNDAWSAPNSIVDLFLESFRIGDSTRWLLNHLVIIALDHKAYSRCLVIHNHCFALITEDVDFSREAYFMTPDYLKMMWRRIDFLRSVLEMGYNFVFTDADVMWFRNPFPRFYSDVDFQIACDHFLGNPDDVRNRPNGGFKFVRSNNRSIEFYKFWYSSRERYPGIHDQDVLNRIKNDSFIKDIELRMRFLNTAYFGGFCEPSKNMSEVCTMHANCCLGLESKLHDLRILLQDWKEYMSLPPRLKISSRTVWGVPANCSLDALRHYSPPRTDFEPLNNDSRRLHRTL